MKIFCSVSLRQCQEVVVFCMAAPTDTIKVGYYVRRCTHRHTRTHACTHRKKQLQ